MNISNEDREKVAVVVAGYNRLKPIQRLFSSLLRADYGGKDVPLVISIDCSNDEVLYDYVRNVDWPYGNKYLRIQEKRLGLKDHILQCGDLTQFFRALILLEDDIFVGEYFYDYTLQALEKYESETHIGGISLYNHEIGANAIPISYFNDGSDSFLRQSVASWGECFTKSQWYSFKEWYGNFCDSKFEYIDMPEEAKMWTASWTKYYTAYLVETNRYFVFPYISHTTCFSDAGEHFNQMLLIGQTNLMSGSRSYYFKDYHDMVRYDVYWVNEDIYKWLKISLDDVCVDLYRINRKRPNRKFLLTTLKMPYKTVRSFGLYLRPIELNVKYEIEGDGLFLYDIENEYKKHRESPFSTDFINYSIRPLNNSMICNYSIDLLLNRIIKKIKSLFSLSFGLICFVLTNMIK